MTHRKYDAWGNYRSGTAPVAGDVRLGYTGHQYDVESGLTYARARYYDSVNGVFLSRDSVEGNLNDAPSLHRFAYAHANPVRYTDSSGRAINFVAAGVGAGAGALIGAARYLYVSHRDGLEFSAADLATSTLTGALIGGVASLTLGAGIEVAATLTTAAKAGALGTGGALVAETSVDIASTAVNLADCVQGAAGSCSAAIVSAADAVTGPNPFGDAATVHAASKRRGTETSLEFPDAASPSVGTGQSKKPGLPLGSAAATEEIVLESAPSSTTTYYHGTNDVGADKVRRGIDLTKGDGQQDFDQAGRGSFYVTKDREQAERWAQRTARDRGGSPAVVSFEVPDSELQSLNGKVFPAKPSQEWSDFVRRSRSGADPEHREFDFVEGPSTTSTDESRKVMSVKRLSGRGDQVAVCTDAAACVFDAAPKDVQVLEAK
jgi:RHS repeat-associated protein